MRTRTPLKKKQEPSDASGAGLKDRLLASAIANLKKQGVHALSMRDIARGAGCSTMATYRHFSSKEHLLSDIACEGFLELRSEIDSVVKAYPKDPVKQLEEVGARYIRMSLRKPEHLLTMFGAVIHDSHQYKDLEKCSENAFFGLVDIVKRCQEEGIIPRGDPVRKAVVCWSIVHGFSMLLLNGNLDWLGITIKNSEEFGSYVARSVIEGLKNLN
jgi:AcrR family transcriptional regulator